MNGLARGILEYTKTLDKYINQQLRTGPGKTPNLENLLAMAWYTVRANTAWLATRYNDAHELTWQIVSTLRLIYKAVADVNYLAEQSNVEDIAEKIISSYMLMKTPEDIISKLQDKEFRQKVNIGSTIEKRIQKEYGPDEGGMYAICCHFTHYNFFGARLAYDFEDPKKDYTRHLALGSLPDLLYRCAEAFSRVGLFSEIQNVTQKELLEMKDLAENEMVFWRSL